MQRNITIVKSETLEIDLDVSLFPSLVDVGTTLEGQIREVLTGTLVGEFSFTVDSINGMILATVPASSTAIIDNSQKSHEYDIFATLSSGARYRLVHGLALIQNTVTISV